MTNLDPQIIDELASAYVLGTLTQTERAQVAQLIRSNPAVEHAVYEWQNRLLPLASAVPPVPPSPRVWEAIEASITAPTRSEKTADRWWHWVRVNVVAGLAMGILLGVGVTLFVHHHNENVPESYVGFLAVSSNDIPIMHAAARRNQNVLFVKMIQPLPSAQDRSLVLWGLSAESPPHRLGVVRANGKTRIALDAPADVTFKNVTVLAVSSEPAGQQLPATPSGEFILKGPCVKLW
jgi:anti-sigma-K factor RskA